MQIHQLNNCTHFIHYPYVRIHICRVYSTNTKYTHLCKENFIQNSQSRHIFSLLIISSNDKFISRAEDLSQMKFI